MSDLVVRDPIASAAVTCGAVPVQIEGQLCDGRWFYFRSRGRCAGVGIGATLDEAVEAQVWGGGLSAERELFGPAEKYAAGYIGLGEASRLLAELVTEALS